MPDFELPSTVVFDLDNTLYDYTESNSFASEILIQEFSKEVALDIAKVSEALTVGRVRIKKRLGNIASSHSRLLYITEAFRVLSLKPKPELFLKLEEVYWSSYLEKMNVFPGVFDLIELLVIRNIQIVLITDLTAQIQYRKLKQLGLGSCFDQIITSEEAGGDKSSSLPYELFSQQLPSDRGRKWFIGDSEFDVSKNFKPKDLFLRKVKHKSPVNSDNILEFVDFGELYKILTTI